MGVTHRLPCLTQSLSDIQCCICQATLSYKLQGFFCAYLASQYRTAGIKVHVNTSGFYIGSGDLHSGLHTCVTSNLLSEPSP